MQDQSDSEEDDFGIRTWSKDVVEELYFAFYAAKSAEDFETAWLDAVGDDEDYQVLNTDELAFFIKYAAEPAF